MYLFRMVGAASGLFAAALICVLSVSAQTAGGAAAASGGGIKKALAAEGGSPAAKQFRGGLGSALRTAATKKRPTAAPRTPASRNRNRNTPPPATRTARTTPVAPPVTSFKPSGGSSAFNLLADSIATTAEEREGLLMIFSATKTAFEEEASALGRKNNIPAALTFFIITNVTVYNDAEEPSAEALEKLWDALNEVFEESPELAAMSDREKEDIYDTLLAMSGISLLGYAQAKQTGGPEMLASYRQIAGVLLQTVLQIEPGSIRFEGDNIVIE